MSRESLRVEGLGLSQQVRPLPDLLFLIVVLLLLSFITYSIQKNEASSLGLLKLSESSLVHNREIDFLYRIEALADLIHGLAQEAVVQQATNGQSAEKLAGVHATFTSLLLRNPYLFQVRWIDGTGHERARVDRRNGEIHVVPGHQLQDKQRRYYTQAAMALSHGHMYLTPLDLNVEQGGVVKPFMPTLRISYRLSAAEDGSDRGFLMLNVDYKDLLERLRSQGVLLINDQGDWLIGPAPELEWRFMFNQRATLEALIPGAMAQIKRHQEVQIEAFNGALLTAHQIVFSKGLSKSYAGRVHPAEHWYLLSILDRESYHSVSEKWGWVLLVSVLLILAASISIYFAILNNRHKQEKIKNAVRSLKEHDERLQAIADAVVEAIICIDSDGAIVFWSKGAERIFGYSMEEVSTLGLSAIIPDRYLGAHRKAVRKAVEDHHGGHRWHPEGKSTDVFGCHKAGHETPVSLSITRFMMSEKLYFVAGVVDISDRIAREEVLQHAKEQAEAANRSKDEFLASMSHELRTPLTAIIGNAEYLSERLVIPELKEVVRDIGVAGQAQLNLVNDILDMSKIESGKFTIEETPYDLARLLRDIENMLKLRVQDAALELLVEQKSREEYKLVGDSHRIGQILINLLSNAIKFTEQGVIQLTSWVESGMIHFEVRDSGIGMTHEEQSRLFKKFEQADGSISRRFGGSGLGLYISFHLAEMMGGAISATSNKGVGSSFILSLPYRTSDIKISPHGELCSDKGGSEQQFSGTVLVVEDTPALQLLERRILEGMGMTVTTADHGQQAVELVEEQFFDLILMDMQMPVMDGIEATRKLREKGVKTPIYALSANVMVKHREQFELAGSDGFVAKPINKDELSTVLERHLERVTEQVARAVQRVEPIEWEDEYSVGSAFIDREHQQVMQKINLLVSFCNHDDGAPSRGKMLQTLNQIHSGMRDHNSREEVLLQWLDYPELEAHKVIHVSYWDRLARLYNHRLDEKQIATITRSLIEWWKDHILNDDMAYKSFLTNRSEEEIALHYLAGPTQGGQKSEELMVLYRKCADNDREKLQEMLSGEEWDRVRHLVDSIKQSSHIFGFPILATSAEKVCDAFDDEQQEALPHLVEKLIDELEQTFS